MTQPDSTSPEHLTPHSGLYFELVQPELIEKAIYEGQSGVIAKALLMNPAESVMLEVKSDGSSFDVESEVRMAFDLSGRRTKRYIDSFVDKLKGGGIEVIERGGRYLFKGQNGTDLVIGEGDILLGWTNITTGDVKEPYDNTTRVFPTAINLSLFSTI